ncbi:hypothetical protein LFAB_10605 [Lactiplantibacillus fabifermentans T30PCM01]|uniref:Uncharacterized protein n=1 Tax=Lactiplantibacillus fabifermentans T30PCM01 TaxID=1400520 RepID=W6TC54_9LACO|nr:hypothetical protein LFAB_10605 [Lactiplantibacillus fabifermentans T30PCM01]
MAATGPHGRCHDGQPAAALNTKKNLTPIIGGQIFLLDGLII